MQLGKIAIFLIYFFLTVSQAATLRVGTVYFYPPFVTSNTTGFDIQFINRLCQNLHDKCELVSMNYNELYNALQTNKIDIAIGGITIDSRPSNYLYSLPYILSKGAFITLKESKLQSAHDLTGKTVGIVRGSQDGDVFYDYLNTNFPKQFEIVKYDDIGSLMSALSNGDIDAAFTHESTVLYWSLNGGGLFKTIDRPRDVGEGIAIMVSVKNASLLASINQQIQQLEQENFYLNLYTTYFANEK